MSFLKKRPKSSRGRKYQSFDDAHFSLQLGPVPATKDRYGMNQISRHSQKGKSPLQQARTLQEEKTDLEFQEAFLGNIGERRKSSPAIQSGRSAFSHRKKRASSSEVHGSKKRSRDTSRDTHSERSPASQDEIVDLAGSDSDTDNERPKKVARKSRQPSPSIQRKKLQSPLKLLQQPNIYAGDTKTKKPPNVYAKIKAMGLGKLQSVDTKPRTPSKKGTSTYGMDLDSQDDESVASFDYRDKPNGQRTSLSAKDFLVQSPEKDAMIDIEDDQDDHEKEHSSAYTIPRKKPVREETTLPSDLLGTGDTKGMLKDFDPKKNRWKQEAHTDEIIEDEIYHSQQERKRQRAKSLDYSSWKDWEDDPNESRMNQTWNGGTKDRSMAIRDVADSVEEVNPKILFERRPLNTTYSSRSTLSLSKQNIKQSIKRLGTKVFPGASLLGTKKSSTTAEKPKSHGDWGSGRYPQRSSTRSRNAPDLSLLHDLESSDDDATPSKQSRKRAKRKSLSKKSKEPEILTLSSDSESDAETETKVFKLELHRIGLGKKIFSNECKISFNPDNQIMKLSFKKPKRRTRRSSGQQEDTFVDIRFRQDSLNLVKYYKPSQNNNKAFPFVSMHVIPHEQNDLSMYSNCYRPNEQEDRSRYVVLNFYAEDDLDYFLAQVIHSLFGEGAAEVKNNEIHKYAEAVLEFAADEKKSLLSSEQRSKFLAGRKKDSILLVYPFDADPSQMEEAAKGLQEASGKALLFQEDGETTLQRRSRKPSIQSHSDSNDSDDAGAKKKDAKGAARQHYVTIRVEDYERLEPREWLNDSLVDFWMQWISRADDKSLTNLHFFTSHFYTTLLKDGPDKVMSWTAKKNINIFEKKFIFIPINKDLHWSLCVVVNPGAIKNAEEEEEDNRVLPCLIFMDSLKLHKKAIVTKKVRNWLNSEWKRINHNGSEEVENRFNKDNFKVYSPTVPSQNNTWDCGVFVCRYAYAIYQLRDRSFTYSDLNGGTPFFDLITSGSEFDFNMDDIVRFREEFKTLLERLSELFVRRKREEKNKSKTASIQSAQQHEDEEGNGSLSENDDDSIIPQPIEISVL